MAYCRFQNTVSDLRDCYEHWDDVDPGRQPEEAAARARMLRLCEKIVADYGSEV